MSAPVFSLISSFALLAVVLRAATLILQSALVGGVVFRRWIAPELSKFGQVRNFSFDLLRTSAIGLAIVQAMSVTLNCIVLSASLDTGFGELISAQFFVAGMMAILAAIIIACAPKTRLNRPGIGELFLAALILAASVMTNHAASRVENRAMLVVVTALHELAAAAWIGGLPYLWLFTRSDDDIQLQAVVAQRFSRLAITCVVALLAGGIAMSAQYIDSPSAVYGTAYGAMVAVKGTLFLVLLTIGAINRKLVRCFTEENVKPRLRGMLEAEIGIGITAILAAASLTSQPPAVDLPSDRLTAGEIYQRFKPVWPRFQSPDVSQISPSTWQVIKDAQKAGLPTPLDYLPGGAKSHPNTPEDIGWSEYNHHWAGVFVLCVGFLTILASTGKFPWARYWPVSFFGLALFILLRADPENWPLGPNGFWESFQTGDVLEHRIFALLIILFAVFEARVQLGRVSSRHATLIFPAVCALGGALLLTHSHTLENVKAALLAEISHVMIALAAIIAGWSRWLEIRLPDHNRQHLSRIWPVCLLIIGLVLLNYREA
jgi:putative copper resistance protein D